MIIHGELTIEDYIAIARRRIWWLVIPAVICPIVAYTISLLLPSRYVSETVVLVEGQTMPDDIVKPIMAGDVNERLATMQEEILSRTRMQQIIDKFGLYKDERGHLTQEAQIALLRKSITVSAVRPMAETRANGLPGFTVSVTAGQAYLAQQICADITSFFTRQNELLRAKRVADATGFLAQQLNDAKQKLDEQDAKLADFQRRYMGELPDEAQTNFSLLSGLATQIEASSLALSRAQQDKIFVESMLSQQLAALKVVHVESSPDPDALQKQLATLQDQLAVLQSRYTDEHPDVIKAKSEIARLQKRMREETPPPSATQAASVENDDSQAVTETPQIKQLRAQLFQINQTIRERTAEQARLQKDTSTLQAKLQLSPAIAQEYKSLTRDSQTALGIYNDLLKKYSDSQMAADLERDQRGEQFRMLDPPNLPQKPSFPNRMVFGMGGLVGGLGLGVGLIALLEVRDSTMRTERDVLAVLKLPTLALIPAIPMARSTDAGGERQIRPPSEPISLSAGV